MAVPSQSMPYRHTVLVVDDDEVVLQRLLELLACDDYTIVTAPNGLVALEYLKETPPSIALLDLHMPVMDSLKLCRLMKQDPHTADIPILLATGKTEACEVEDGLAAGASDFIKKPFDSDELRIRVRNQLRLRDMQLAHRRIEKEYHLLFETSQDTLMILAPVSWKFQSCNQATLKRTAGIAHEINTPAQYVGDGVHFLRVAFECYQQLLTKYCSAVEILERVGEATEIVSAIRELENDIDLHYLRANIPGSFERCIDGITRISTIVHAMKEFSHPDQREKSSADLNQALRSTLIIARNEYKYIASIEPEFGDLPPVLCHVGDLNQVFLNLIVNAAHAIADVVDNEGLLGQNRIRTRQEGDWVLIDITDSGTAIPQSIRGRIFDPVFTTKEVGKGSGQGLAIARLIIVDKHCGSLTFKTDAGSGTIFTIRLPIDGKGRPKGAELS